MKRLFMSEGQFAYIYYHYNMCQLGFRWSGGTFYHLAQGGDMVYQKIDDDDVYLRVGVSKRLGEKQISAMTFIALFEK